MKKILFVLAGLLALQSAQACDICGCAGASAANFPGNFNRENQLGWMYHFLAYQSRHLPSIQAGQVGVEKTTQEFFHLSAFTAGIRVAKNWQANAVIPVQYVVKEEEGARSHVFGLSDMQVGITRFFEVDSVAKDQRLLASASYAVKLPTGLYNPDMVDETVSRFMIPGTGSFDHFFRGNVQYSIRKWSLTLGGLYRLNGSTKEDLNWGNRFQLQGDVGRVFELPKMNELFASLGYLYEKGFADDQNGESLPFSEYATGQLKTAVQWRKNRMAGGLLYFIPVAGEIADGRVKIQSRFQIQLTYYPNF